MKLYQLLVIFVLLLLPRPSQGASPPPLTIAVFEFESRDTAGKAFAREISALVMAHLSAEAKFVTLERAELDKLLGEQELGLSGTVSTDTAARVGHLTGAKVLVLGRTIPAASEQVVVAKVVGTETGRVFGEMVKSGKDAPASELAEALARKIATTTLARADVLVAKPPTQEDRIQGLKGAIKTPHRPSVSVKIPEQHLGHAVPDPAAETELSLMLRTVGCELLDEKSVSTPELEFSGEAFSETAGRKGSLFCVKARVELKVRERATGKLLVVDREVRFSIDTAEHIAAKQALADAATELAIRVLPQVIR